MELNIKKFRRPGHDPQITFHVDTEGNKCLKFVDDPHTKTNQGGLTTKFHLPKIVHCYPNVDQQRCLYRLYSKYINLLPSNGKSKSLYLYGRRKPLPNVWYEDRPVGINCIRPVINHLFTVAGFTDGKFVNESLRSGSCTHMFDNNTDEQVIQSVSGHHSTCVRMYKCMSDKLRREASEAIQGSIVSNDCEKSKGNGESITKCVNIEIEAAGKRKLSRVQGSEGSTICDLISSVSKEKKVQEN